MKNQMFFPLSERRSIAPQKETEQLLFSFRLSNITITLLA